MKNRIHCNIKKTSHGILCKNHTIEENVDLPLEFTLRNVFKKICQDGKCVKTVKFEFLSYFLHGQSIALIVPEIMYTAPYNFI